MHSLPAYHPRHGLSHNVDPFKVVLSQLNLVLREEIFKICRRYIFYRTRVRSLATLVTNSLITCHFVDLIHVTLACEDANSKLVEVVADVGAKDHVGNSLLQIWELTFGPET